MRVRLRFTFIFAAKISHPSIDNNVKLFTLTHTHSVNEPLIIYSFLDAGVIQFDISAALHRREHTIVKNLILHAKKNNCHFVRPVRDLALRLLDGKRLNHKELKLLKYELEMALDNISSTDPEIQTLLQNTFKNFKDDDVDELRRDAEVMSSDANANANAPLPPASQSATSSHKHYSFRKITSVINSVSVKYL